MSWCSTTLHSTTLFSHGCSRRRARAGNQRLAACPHYVSQYVSCFSLLSRSFNIANNTNIVPLAFTGNYGVGENSLLEYLAVPPSPLPPPIEGGKHTQCPTSCSDDRHAHVQSCVYLNWDGGQTSTQVRDS